MIIGNGMGAIIIEWSTVSMFYLVLSVICLFGALFFWFLPQFEAKEAKEEESRSSMRQTWELLTSRRMMFFVPVLIYTAISDAIYMSLLVPLLARTMLN